MHTRILSIDGGGMKGIVSAVVINELEVLLQKYSNNPNARIAEYFDLIAGTSTGSILTALYLLPENGHPKYSAKEILNLYPSLGKSIFQKQTLYPLFGSKYTSNEFEKTLKLFFEQLKISDLLKPCLITSYNTTSRTAVFFNTETAKKDRNRDYLVWEAVKASCAAPTYFPPATLSNVPEHQNCFIDGGVVANNPALCAIIEALKLTNCESIHDLYLLSVGNIENDTNYYCREVKKWGLIEWASPLFSILLNSNLQTVDYQLKTLFKILNKEEQYIRLQLNGMRKVPELDDYSEATIDYLMTCGDELIETSHKELEQFAKWLVMAQEK